MKQKILLISLAFASLGTNAQNVGINNNAPQFPLSFDAQAGDKISLWSDGSSTHYGLGIQSSLLQLFSKTEIDDIAFGYGSSNAFTERMRVRNSGEYGMELTGRVLLKTSADLANAGITPGIWFNKASNSGLLGFMGSQGEQNLGFYGGPAGWGLTYDAINSRVGIGNISPNAPLAFGPSLGKKIVLYPGSQGDAGFGMAGNRLQIFSDNSNADVAIGFDNAGTFNERFAIKPTGALAVNGNTGNAGQVLQSNGDGSPASWASTTSQLFNNSLSFGLTDHVLTTGTGVIYALPGLDQTITLAQTSKLLVSIHVAGYNNGCFACGDAVAEFRLQVDNSSNFFQYKAVYVANSSSFDLDSGLRILTLPPGTHNFKMTVKHNLGGDIDVYKDAAASYGTRMTILVLPQ